jgi:hypothetical protein
MRAVIIRSQQFNKGFKEGVTAKEAQLNEQDEETKQNAKEGHQIKRVGKIDENLKYGRGKKTAHLFKEGADPKTD